MAKKKKQTGIDRDEFLGIIKDRFNRSKDATEQSYRDMVDDLHFLNGDQWDTSIEEDRRLDGRPCLTINKLPTFIDQIVGDQRMNRPGIKIKPVDSGADKETAEVIQGLIKNIEVQSDAAIAYDTAFDGAVSCGFGVFRISSEYVDDNSFDQELRILPITNQFSAYFDPDAQKWNKEDGDFWILTEMMERKSFLEKFPDASTSSFQSGRDDDWGNEEKVRVAEYFYKEHSTEKLFLVEDVVEGQQMVINSLSEIDEDLFNIVKERDVEKTKIMWVRVTDTEILEGPKELKGQYIPIVPVFGKNVNIENQVNYRGAVRNAKDPQRLYNYNRSASAELISLAPKAPYLLTPKQVANHEKEWTISNKRNFTYLLYNPDPMAKGIPQRQNASPISAGIQQEVMVSDQELHDTTGLQRSSLGKQGNEKSGKAIMARQKEGDIGSYQFTDNLIRAMTHCGRILVDLIPIYYDTARVIRILQEDGEDRPVAVNQMPQREGERLYDLSTGKYDVVVTVGPSFTTQRQEAVTSMMEFLQYVPDAGPIIADLVAKNMDWPGADQIEKRLKKMLPPGVAEEEGGGGQQQPNPQQQQEQQQMQMQQQQAAQQMAKEETLSELEINIKEEELKQSQQKTRQENLKVDKISADIDLTKTKTEEIEFKVAGAIADRRATGQVQ